MTAARFTWRSPRAVQHQSKSARVGWKRWVVVEPAPNSFVPPKCRLTDFGQPTIWDVFSEAIRDPHPPYLQRGVPAPPAPSLSDLKADLPYGRLKKALQSGILTALTGGQRDRVPPAYWRANLDAHVHGTLNRSHAVLKSGIFFRQEEVIRAESLVAKKEFDPPVVGVEQAVGWIAYRNVENFRSLGKKDLRGRQYHGASYEADYSINRPEKELFDALVAGRIKGYRKIEDKIRGYRRWEELTLTTRMEANSIWDFSGVRFFRTHLIDVWPFLSGISGSPGPHSPISVESIGQSTNDKKAAPRKRGKTRTGPKTWIRKDAIKELQADIASGEQSLESLWELWDKGQTKFAEKYHVKSRSTALKALEFLQDEADTLSATNSGQ